LWHANDLCRVDLIVVSRPTAVVRPSAPSTAAFRVEEPFAVFMLTDKCSAFADVEVTTSVRRLQVTFLPFAHRWAANVGSHCQRMRAPDPLPSFNDCPRSSQIQPNAAIRGSGTEPYRERPLCRTSLASILATTELRLAGKQTFEKCAFRLPTSTR
jgi:hypothetical protein